MSGAGKSQAMSAFEDEGWFCIDNIPPRMLPRLMELARLEGARLDRIAVACDVRGGGRWLAELTDELDTLVTVDDVATRIIFLEASDDALLTRFRETRRRHPLADGGGVQAGITRERDLLGDLRERADVVIDTSNLNIWELRRIVSESFMPSELRRRLQVAFVSFGFKHGVPRDVDLMFDVRFLKNPYYEPELAALTGRDQAVIDYLDEVEGMSEFRDRLEALLDFLLPAYAREGKSHLVVAFGCTGGRHRSVRFAELMGARYAGGDYDVSIEHRDVARANRPAVEADAP